MAPDDPDEWYTETFRRHKASDGGRQPAHEADLIDPSFALQSLITRNEDLTRGDLVETLSEPCQAGFVPNEPLRIAIASFPVNHKKKRLFEHRRRLIGNRQYWAYCPTGAGTEHLRKLYRFATRCIRDNCGQVDLVVFPELSFPFAHGQRSREQYVTSLRRAARTAWIAAGSFHETDRMYNVGVLAPPLEVRDRIQFDVSNELRERGRDREQGEGVGAFRSSVVGQIGRQGFISHVKRISATRRPQTADRKPELDSEYVRNPSGRTVRLYQTHLGQVQLSIGSDAMDLSQTVVAARESLRRGPLHTQFQVIPAHNMGADFISHCENLSRISASVLAMSNGSPGDHDQAVFSCGRKLDAVQLYSADAEAAKANFVPVPDLAAYRPRGQILVGIYKLDGKDFVNDRKRAFRALEQARMLELFQAPKLQVHESAGAAAS